MGLLYGKYDFLSTGGCIGDTLFFFCSGFTLFFKPMNGYKAFPDWYKRRINRIYPSLIAVAIIACVFFDTHWDILDILVAKRYWFISCIMLYYIAIFFIGSFFKKHIFLISVLVVTGSAFWFSLVYERPRFSLYSGNYIRWLLFFIFMLLGAKLGTIAPNIKIRPYRDVFLLIVCIACFYALFFIGLRIKGMGYVQFFTVLPLYGINYYFYKVCASPFVGKIYNNKIGHFIIRFVGGLCLEIYMVQHFLFTDKMNSIFPLNIIIMLLVIIVVAYLTRCLARLISQTFNNSPYNWREIVELY